MKVVILGGYGVFGSRLAQLLLRDGHEVWLAGRSLDRARRCAAEHGGQPLQVDISGDLSPILGVAPGVVIDAAGPFHLYRDDPYRVVRFCIDHRINYLDLSDDAAFAAGIGSLDDAAAAAGRFALSGVSSVPGLSSAVVAALAKGLDSIDVIETAILPGNRAPRGRSVMASILAQVGTSIPVWRGGIWRDQRSWSDRRTYRLDGGLRRTARLIEVPDLALFPHRFGARSVVFRAGLELSVLNAGLSALAWLRSAGLWPAGPPAVAPSRWLAARLERFGTDRGAMIVEVTGTKDDMPVRRLWTLTAEAGAGPFVPGIMARALLRSPDRIQPGARPCLCEAPLDRIEDTMTDLAVATVRTEEPRPTLFRSTLGETWHELPAAVQRLHSVQDTEIFSGSARIHRGTGAVARLAGWMFRFPAAAPDVPLTVTKTRTPSGEIWERNFGGRVFLSVFTPAGPLHYRERFGPLTFEQHLPVTAGTLHFPVRRGWLLGIPLPRFLLPRSDAREYQEDGRFRFDVALSGPLGIGLIIRYRGTVSPDARPAAPLRPDRPAERSAIPASSAQC